MNEIIIGGGHYSFREPLGSGGMAEVFLARDEVLERDVAVKILKEQYAGNVGFIERFRREARSAASLNHPHIIVVYDWGRSAAGTYCMAMEYAPGGTLKDRISEDGSLPPHMAVEIASQITEALGFAHARGVIHRNVKPHNILLTDAGEAKVADFGIARAATTTSRSNLFLGTPSYMSPEQAKGERVGPASDLYSLGIVLYEMLTGELPYEAEDAVALAVKHVEELPRSPREANPKVPEVLEALTLRLLAKDPTDRYGSATELLKDLRRVRNGLPPPFAGVGPVTASRTVLSASVSTILGAGGTHRRSYAVYGGSSKRPLALTGAFVALLVLLSAVVWGPWWGNQELVQAQDVVRGGLEEPGASSDKDKRPTRSKEVFEVGDLQEVEGQQDPKANISSPKLGNVGLVGGDATSQGSVDDEDRPGAVLPVEPVSEDNVALGPVSERVSVPEVRGASAEVASQALSDSGHMVVGTTKQRSPEPPGTVIETYPAVGSSVERGTAVAIMLSRGPTSQEDSNSGEDEWRVTTKKETTEVTQPSKSRKRNQRSSTAVFVKG